MEKAILKTLIYADIFDYPLKAWEIHKWLIAKKASLTQIDRALKKLTKAKKVGFYKDYYFLPKRVGIVKKRTGKLKQSKYYLFQAKLMGGLFRTIPWIKLVGISGSLAVNNINSKDDIDFFIVAEKNRIWIARVLILGVLEVLGKRRKASDSKTKASGKACINLLLEENDLAQNNKNIYVAHEVLQMQVLWQRDKVYSKYLDDNNWVFKYLPNWIGSFGKEVRGKRLEVRGSFKVVDLIENLCRLLQLKYMSSPKGAEKVTNTALYFHPENYQEKVLKEYKKRINRL